MTKQPLVSIIIPTHNRAHKLLRAARSALNQTHKEIEVIIVDDCSNDETPEMVGKLNHKRITYIQNKKNLGAPASRNKGLAAANGQYVNFLDDDDEIHPDKIKKQLQRFQNSKEKNLAVVTCDVEYKRSDIHAIKKNRLRGNIYKELLKAYCVYGTETMLIQKTAVKEIGGFDKELEANQEYDLQIRLAKKHTFDYVPEVLATKHETPGQISFNFNKKIHATKKLYHKHKQEYKKQNVYAYNLLRFTYLLTKYRIGKYLGKKVYTWLP